MKLDKSKGGFQYALVVCDHFTKFVQVHATKNKSGLTAADRIFNDFILKFGFPNRIHHAQGKEFHNHHSFNVSVPLKVGCTAPMFVLSFFLHSILFAGSALDSFQCLRSLLIVSFHVFLGLPRPRCPTTSNSVMLLIQPSFLTTCPNQRS